MCCMNMMGEHKMKIKTQRTNNKTCLKWYLKLPLFKTARAHKKSFQKNFSSISLKQSLTVRDNKLRCNALQLPNSRLIKIQILRSDLVFVWVKAEGKEGEKKGKKREKKIEKDKDRDRKIR